jgi:hypothetical protein
MSQEDVSTIRSFYDAFRRKDLPAIFAVLHPQVEFSQSALLPWGGIYRGQEENRGLGLKYHMNRKLGSSSPHQCLAPSFLRDDASDPSTAHLSSCTSRRCTSAVSVSIR